jgi:methyl acetate hydrolase
MPISGRSNRVLKESSVARMLENRMGPLKFEKMVTVAPTITADFDPFAGTPKTHSFGFMRNEADIPGRRKAGSQSWAGVLNTHCWFDPPADLAGLITTQTLPFVEPPFMAPYEAFEKTARRRLRRTRYWTAMNVSSRPTSLAEPFPLRRAPR